MNKINTGETRPNITTHFGEIASLKILAGTAYLPTVTGFVREIAPSFELDSSATYKLELLVEEAVLNVIYFGFEKGERGEYEVIFKRIPGGVVVEVAGRGQPVDYDKIEGDPEAGLGLVLLKRLADEVNFINRGKNGKAVEIVLDLAYQKTEELDSIQRIDDSAESAHTDEELVYRLATKNDTFGITKSIYRTYGYSYLSETLYFPEKISELIEQGYLVSAVASNPKGEVVGHASIRFDFPGAIVGEFGRWPTRAIADAVSRAISTICSSNTPLHRACSAITPTLSPPNPFPKRLF